MWRVQLTSCISQSPLFLAWLVKPLLFSSQLPVHPASPAASPGFELWPFLQYVMLYSMQLPPLPCIPAVLPTWPYFSPYYSNVLELERTLKVIWDNWLHCCSPCPIISRFFLLPWNLPLAFLLLSLESLKLLTGLDIFSSRGSCLCFRNKPTPRFWRTHNFHESNQKDQKEPTLTVLIGNACSNKRVPVKSGASLDLLLIS